MNELEVFNGGASRSVDRHKLSYNKGLSVQVLKRYLQYLQEHRVLPDGTLRDFDNWKAGMPKERYQDALLRHVWDADAVSKGLVVWEDPPDPSEGDPGEKAELEDLLCAVIFNASGWLFELLVEKSRCRERV